MTRYPENTVADLDSFRGAACNLVISALDREGYSSMWQSLSKAANEAIESGKVSEGKVLWLLADACSMMLTPNSINEPFRPLMIMDGKRSSLPEDFQQEDIALFSQAVEEVDDVWLKARIADLVWLLQKPRNVKFALMAVDAYREIPLTTETWVRGGRECWERAVSLCLMLRSGAGDRLKEIETSLVSTTKSAMPEDGFLALWLADTMLANHLGHAEEANIANHLETLSRRFDSTGDLHRSKEFFEASAKWYKRAKNENKAVEMTVLVAEAWVKEAMARLSSEHPSHMVAASFYENAIQKYRTIPKSQREFYKVDERILELNKLLAESGECSLSEMGVISSPRIDISEIVENARNAVRGKTAIDALLAFSNIYHGARVANLRDTSKKMLQEHPLQALFSSTHMSRDGRVIAKRPGMGLGNADSEENEVVLWAEMVKHYGMELGLVVQGDIWPALEILHLEQRLREADFVSVCNHSPIVPPGREHLFGKGLFAGYDKDFASAIHLLVPQIEHLVRYHLKARGVKTTNLDINGIENENGLSTLIDLPEVKEIFGENIAFEINALFCDAFGPNLRNEVAHGLLDYEECSSIYSVYAWWICLKLAFNTFWNARNNTKNQADTNSGA
ncbi:MAG: DUF4209 domain-containing protein [Desulfuromonadaceae bacterium]|nr:DUF4209 domain-containing protein [Desulfuromonadaceae bacterium]